MKKKKKLKDATVFYNKNNPALCVVIFYANKITCFTYSHFTFPHKRNTHICLYVCEISEKTYNMKFYLFTHKNEKLSLS